jgi:serine/threonine protein kinase
VRLDQLIFTKNLKNVKLIDYLNLNTRILSNITSFSLKKKHICVVLESCDIDLDKFLENHYEKNIKIDKDLAIKWLKQLVSAVKYLHSKNLHHRDIKPLLDCFFC